MIPDNVVLIVKAPNQQIEDQNIECQSSWTVRQLKGHLSEVYPSKPSTDEQKIIYSGQLLDDNTVLKDVLRTYESQLGHTMHLVCAPSKTMTNPPIQEQKDGLRQRNVNTTAERTAETTPRPAEPVTRPEMRQNDQNHTVEMQNYLSSFVNNYGRVPPYPNYNIGEGYLPVPTDQASLANHMIMMQQAYMRYMQQYANMWQGAASAAPAAAPEPAAAPAAEPAPDDDERHDWLDHVYSASRLAILFSLIYLYGSPARLVLVVAIALAAYLHQIGFFRELFVNDNQAAQQPQQQNQQPQQPQQQPQQAQQQPQQAQQQPQQAQQQPTNRPEEPIRNQPEVDQSPSFLAVSWMVFVTFFSSLIPETNH